MRFHRFRRDFKGPGDALIEAVCRDPTQAPSIAARLRGRTRASKAHPDQIESVFEETEPGCALDSMRLSHFLRRTGAHFGGKCFSVPIPKFASLRGMLSRELRNQRNTRNINASSAAYEFEVPKRASRKLIGTSNSPPLKRIPIKLKRPFKRPNQDAL